MKHIYSAIFLSLCSLMSFGQATGDFRSFASGDWNNVNTWERFNGTIWVNPAPTTPTSADGIITLMSGTTITIPNGQSITADQIEFENIPFSGSTGALFVAAGGTLIINNGTGDDIRLLNDFVTFASLQVAGTLQLNTGATMVDDDYFNLGIGAGPVTNLTYQVLNGGVHVHSTGAGVDVIPDAGWQSGSTCQINATSGTVPSIASSIAFHHFVWNGTVQSTALNLAGQLSVINGDLIIQDTNNQFLLLSQNSTLTVGGDFVMQGQSRLQLNSTGTSTFNISGNLNISSTSTTAPFAVSFNATGSSTINVTGNFLKSNASTVNMTVATGTTNLNILGDFSLTGGVLTKGSGPGTINFNGATTNTFTNSGTISGTIGFVVASLKTLNLGTSSITGTGPLTVNGTLGLGSTDASGALQTGVSGGNIRVSGIRTYSSGSTIMYNGTGAQFIGNGFPSGGDVNLSINNPSNVTLSTSLDIVALRTLNLISGNIVIGTQTLTINGTVSGSGGIVGGPSSKMVIGGTGNFGTLNFSGSNQLLDFTMNRTSSGLVTLGDNLEILGTLTQTEGELDLNGNTLTIGGAFARSFGTLGVDAAASIIINGSGVLPSGSTGITGASLGTLTMNRSGATLDASASVTITNLNLTSGTLNNGSGLAMASGGTITRAQQGAMTASPNNTTNAYNVVYNTTSPISSGPELPSNTTALANLTKLGSGTLTLISDITVNGILTFSSGTFNSGANDLNLKGNLVSNAASVLTGSNVTFSGTSIISGSTPPVFGGIIVTGTLTPSANFNINGDLTNNGTLNAGSATVTFGGTTNFLGAGPYNFNNVSITGILNAPTTMSVAGNWSNSGTFNRGLASNNVTFNGTTSFTGPGTTTFSSITITGTLNSSATLRVAGNFTNNGTFVAGTGTLLLNGSSVQSIAGSTATTFNNLTVTNTANPLSVQVQSNQNMRGILTLSANTIFDADGSGNTSIFTLLSSADDPSVTDAAIAELPSGAQVTGNVTVQRYMSIEGGSNSPAFNNGRIYRYISSPVASAPVSQIQVFNPVTGTFTGSSTCTGCTTTQSMFLYNESVITDTNGSGTPDLNDGYEDFPSTVNSETLATGRGYAMFVWGNVPPVSTAGNALWSVRNAINSGTIDFVATAGASFTAGNGMANDGWNLVGNPYPSTIDWDAASGWTKTGLTNTIYMKDNGALAGTYASYVGGVGGTNGGSRYIPIGQAFWVKATSAPTFQATEAVKAPGNTTTFFRTSPPSDLMRVTLRSGLKRDEILIYFEEDATEEFDGNGDAYKLENDIFNLSTVTPLGDKLAINGLPMLECSKVLKLNITDVSTGAYQLDFTEFESFITPVNIFLLDKKTGENIDVKENPSYEFEVTAEESSYKDRFELNITNLTIDPTLLISSTTNGTSCKEGAVTISAEGTPAGGSYRWYENETDQIAIAGQNSSQFTTPVLEKSTTYYVSAVSQAGCEGVRVPVMAEVITFDDVVLSDLENGILSSSYVDNNQWFKDGVLIPGANGQNYTPVESGVYKVEVSFGSCVSSAERAVTITGIEDEDLSGLLTLYPNPVEDVLTVKFSSRELLNPSIVDMMGRKLGTLIMKPQDQDFVGTYDFRSHPGGIYLLKVSDKEGKVITKRIFKK